MDTTKLVKEAYLYTDQTDMTDPDWRQCYRVASSICWENNISVMNITDETLMKHMGEFFPTVSADKGTQYLTDRPLRLHELNKDNTLTYKYNDVIDLKKNNDLIFTYTTSKELTVLNVLLLSRIVLSANRCKHTVHSGRYGSPLPTFTFELPSDRNLDMSNRELSLQDVIKDVNMIYKLMMFVNMYNREDALRIAHSVDNVTTEQIDNFVKKIQQSQIVEKYLSDIVVSDYSEHHTRAAASSTSSSPHELTHGTTRSTRKRAWRSGLASVTTRLPGRSAAAARRANASTTLSSKTVLAM